MKEANPKQFFETLYQPPCPGFLNLRFLNKTWECTGNYFVNLNQEDWYTKVDVPICVHSQRDEHCFFGVALHNSMDGTKETISSIPAVFTDIDFKDSSKEAVRKAIENLRHLPCPLAPSIYVMSGGGVHTYFLFKEPLRVDSKTLELYENIVAEMVIKLRGDINATDASRILRIPGTLNHKYDPPEPVKAYAQESIPTYDVSDFDLLKTTKDLQVSTLIQPTTQPFIPEQVLKTTKGLLKTTKGLLFTEGRRDSDLFHLANTLARGNMGEKEIYQHICSFANHCTPPMNHKTAWIKVQSALRRHPGNIMNITSIPKPGPPISLHWPLGIEQWIDFYPNNICVIAGERNMGKTAYLLRFTANQIHNPDFHLALHYHNSEMDEQELRMRVDMFHDMVLSDWNSVTFHKITRNFAKAITPGACNIIDYLEVHDNFYAVAGILNDIWEALKGGIAIVALQKNPGRDEGLGGHRGLEKPRLYMSMSKDWPGGRLKLVKAKNWTGRPQDPNDMSIKYTITDASTFTAQGEWGNVRQQRKQQKQEVEVF